jgi:hypothetical protein
MKMMIVLLTVLMGPSTFAQATGEYSCVVQGSRGMYLGKTLTASQITELTNKAQQSPTGTPEIVKLGSYDGAEYAVEFYSAGISLLVTKNGQEVRASGDGMNASYSFQPVGNGAVNSRISFSCLKHVME